MVDCLWKKYIFILIGCICSGVIAGCRSDESRWKKTAEEVVRKYRGRHLVYPREARNLFFLPEAVDSVQRAPFKIVTFIDGDCGICSSKLAFWRDFVDSLRQKEGVNVPVLVYAYARKGEFFLEITENLKYNGIWLYDHDQRFVVENELSESLWQTVLVDQEDKILLIGDPVWNKALQKLYAETIVGIKNTRKAE